MGLQLTCNLTFFMGEWLMDFQVAALAPAPILHSEGVRMRDLRSDQDGATRPLLAQSVAQVRDLQRRAMEQVPEPALSQDAGPRRKTTMVEMGDASLSCTRLLDSST